MDITAYIRELLFGHDCVIVPGFGGLIGNYAPAHIDKKSGTFYPPVKQISFNRNLNHNDGLLVGRISGSTGINYGDARNMVEEFAGDLKRRLDKGEKIVFDHIGSFINNQEGNIQFEPDRSANYHLDSFGLESFRMLPLEGYNIRERVTKTAGRDPDKVAAMRRIMWRAAVIVPLLTVLVIVPLKTDLFKAKVESSNLNPLVTAEFEQNRKAVDSGLKTIEEVKQEDAGKVADASRPELKPDAEVKVPAARPEVTSPVVSEPVAGTAETFVLITGSFKSEENAMSQVKMLREEGFTPEIVEGANGFFRVFAMTCHDLATAQIKKDSLAGKFPGVWISRKK